MHENGVQAGLTGAEDAAGSRGEGEKKTRAQREEERGADDEIVPGKNKTHSPGDEAVYEEEDERVEEDGHLTGFAVSERNLGAVGGQNNTGAQCEKKSRRDSHFLSSKIGGKHLIYTHKIFSKVYKVVKCCTTHHISMKTIFVDTAPEISPNVSEPLFIPSGLFLIVPRHAFMIRVMIHVTEFHKITKLPCVVDMGVVHECVNHVPHVSQFI